MKITVLAENTALNDSFECEHGLSLYIETENKNILFDMGQTDLFYRNALKTGVDVSETDIAVLSHGHYDHGGGLEKFLCVNDKAPVYISKYAFEPHFSGTEKYIGLDTSLEKNERLIFCDGETKIDDNISLLSLNEEKPVVPVDPCGLYMQRDNEKVFDDFRHEQYLVICEKGRKTVISGCSHKGIINIVSCFKPDVLVGGFHFSKYDTRECAEMLTQYAQKLLGSQAMFYTCHCTGVGQYGFLKKQMNARLEYIQSGKTIII